jgi:hypothetical protein
VTVGGLGRLQVLLATHFPGIYAHFGRPLAALLSDPDKPKTESDNLDAGSAEGRERSLDEAGRRFSLYAPFSRHPAMPFLAGAALLGGLAYLTKRQPRLG